MTQNCPKELTFHKTGIHLPTKHTQEATPWKEVKMPFLTGGESDKPQQLLCSAVPRTLVQLTAL